MSNLKNAVAEAEAWLDMELPVINYNPEWANGTGYLDRATKAEVECISKFVDDKDRFGIIIPLGKNDNLVIFERYNHGEGDIIVYNVAVGSPWRNLIDTVLDGRTVGVDDPIADLIVAITLQNK